MFFEEHPKATTPCGSWAMTPEQRNQRAPLATDCVLLNRGLSAFFGELVKYNCVILYKAVLGWQRPQKLHYSAFYWGVKKGTFSWWWITSLSHEVKVKHTRVGGGGGSGGCVLRWMYMDHLKWNQFSWRIRAGCHNGFYLTPINSCIDLQVGSNPVRTEGWGGEGGRGGKKNATHTNTWAAPEQM